MPDGRRASPAAACILTLVTLAAAGASAAQGVPAPSAAEESRRGWAALQDGRHEEAAEAFSQALRLAPRDPALHTAQGLAWYLLGRLGDARTALERALALAPRTTTASLLLGDILYRSNELDAALEVYEAARAFAPDDERLADRLDAARREAAVQRGFQSAQGSHFTVLFEGPADEALARRALALLEDAYWRIGTALLLFPDITVPVVLYTEQQFQDVTRSPDWAAAAFDGRIRVPMRGALEDVVELERVLSHELTHALVRSVTPRGLPTWFHEGLAVYFEAGGAEWTDTVLGGTTARLPAARLERGFDGLSAEEARLAYAQSAAAVRAIVDTAGTYALAAILQDLARGEPFPRAFGSQVLVPYETFVGEYLAR